MKAKDLLQWRIEEYLKPTMTDLGFGFAPSSKSFRRRAGQFSQVVDFSSSHYNSDDSCSFQTGWSIESGVYKKWYQETYGKPPAMGRTVLAIVDNGIPGWRKCIGRSRIVPRLRNEPSDMKTMDALKRAFTTVGVPFLEEMSAWEAVAEHYKGNMGYWTHVCDLLLIADQKEEARIFLNQGLDATRVSDNINAWRYVEELEDMKEKLFSDSD